MNNRQRIKLRRVRAQLDKLRDEVDDIKGEEEDKQANAPEGLQSKYEDDIENLDTAVEGIADAICSLELVTGD